MGIPDRSSHICSYPQCELIAENLCRSVILQIHNASANQGRYSCVAERGKRAVRKEVTLIQSSVSSEVSHLLPNNRDDSSKSYPSILTPVENAVRSKESLENV